MKENEVLARFMELKSRKIFFIGDEDITVYYEDNPDIWFTEPEYDKSWDLLMLVVAKIRLLLQDNDLYERAKNHWGLIEIALSTVEIKAVNVAVLHFIEWYNANKQL